MALYYILAWHYEIFVHFKSRVKGWCVVRRYQRSKVVGRGFKDALKFYILSFKTLFPGNMLSVKNTSQNKGTGTVYYM